MFKKITVGLFTIIVSLAAVLSARFYLLILLKSFPVPLCALCYFLVLFLFFTAFIAFILKKRPKNFGLGKFKLKFIWILNSLLLPVFIFVGAVFLPGNWSFDNTVDYKSLLYFGSLHFLAWVLVDEMLARGMILRSCTDVLSNFAACVIVSLIVTAMQIQDFTIPVMDIVRIAVEYFIISMLLCLVSLHSENVWNSALVSFMLTLFNNLVSIGVKPSKFAILKFETSVNPWIITALKVACALVFILVAHIGLKKRRKDEVLYW